MGNIIIKLKAMAEKDFELTPDSNIIKTVEKYPAAASVFAKHGIPCLGCAAAHFETLSDISGEFGIEAEELIKEIEEASK